jgi:starch phosphorylase
MKEKTDIRKPFYSVLPSDLEGMDPLARLALDMRWSWDHGADQVWRQFDPALWDLTHNPWVVLQTVSGNNSKCNVRSEVRKKVIIHTIKEQAFATPAGSAKLSSLRYLYSLFQHGIMLSEAL